MNPEELRALLEAARAALADGKPRDAVEAAVRARAGMSLAELQASAGPAIERATPPAVGIPLAGAMGATGGFLDEIVGSIAAARHQRPAPFSRGAELAYAGQAPAPLPGAPEEKYRTARDRVRRLYAKTPGIVRTPSEIAGAFATPAGTIGRGARALSLPRAMARGAAFGAAGGALAGAGYAPELEDVPAQAGLTSLFGATVGAALPAAPGIVRSVTHGTGGQRLARAVEAGGGPEGLRRAAAEATRVGYGGVTPIAALSPYLTKEAEFAATRVPEVGPRYGTKLAQTRAGEAERLIRGVSEITETPQVGREAIAAARATEFEPLYEAIAKGPNTLVRRTADGVVLDPKIADFVARPYVSLVFRRMVEEGLIQADEAAQPGFRALHRLRQELSDAANTAFQAEAGGRGTALRRAATELDEILENAFPDYRAVQNAYRRASVPVNVIDLARLEVARQGRASASLDRASREMRRELLRAFGSGEKYRAFMRRVDQERKIAELQQRAFGGSATAGRLLGESAIQPENVAEVAARSAVTGSSWPLSGLVGSMIPAVARERAGRQMAPLLFRPSRDVESVLAQIEAMRARQGAGRFSTNVGPFAVPGAARGLFPEDEEPQY